MDLSDPAKLHELRLRINQESAAHVRGCTIPILGRTSTDDGTPTVHGTGILLEISGEGFLLTAGHVADISGKNSTALYIPGTRRELPYVSLNGCAYESTHSADSRHMDDPYDIAVARLPDAVMSEIRNPLRFLRLEETDPSDPAIEGIPLYLACGFPTAWAFHDFGRLNTKAIALEAFKYQGNRGWPKIFKADRHVAVDYLKVKPMTWTGEKFVAPKGYGVSGGGLWRMVEPGTSPDRWESSVVKLVGIIHYAEWSTNVMIATQFEFVVGMIRRCFPKLRTAIDLHVNSTWTRKGWKPRML